MVDVVGRLGVQVPNGSLHTAARCRTASNPRRSSISTSRTSFRIDSISWRRLAECACGEQIEVEPDDVVTSLLEQWSQDGADVAVMAGDEYAHEDSPGIRTTCLPSGCSPR